MALDIPTLKKAFDKKKYTWYTDRPNLIGIRTSLMVPDVFNDIFVAVWTQPEITFKNPLEKQQKLNRWFYVGENGLALQEDGAEGKNTKFAWKTYQSTVGKERMKAWSITTLPGVFCLVNPNKHNKAGTGTAILKPGQYADVYERGFHQHRPDHPALVQRGKLTVYRDSNKNQFAEETDRTETGIGFGINIHRTNANGTSSRIGEWSAGCQVFPSKSDHDQLLSIVNELPAPKGKYTYTLLKEIDLNG